MNPAETGAVVDGRPSHRKRRRTLVSCTECHRRKQKCDRDHPCQNCVSRCKPEVCRYERLGGKNCTSTSSNVISSSSGESSIESSTPYVHSSLLSGTNRLSLQDHGHLVDTLGYSTHNEHNTFSLVNKVGASNPSIPTATYAFDRKQTALQQQYWSLVRQLPSQEYINVLVHQFFSEMNWQYDVLDEITFRRQLETWRLHPYSAHSQTIDSLPAELIALPSLVAQVMAHSLIHQPVDERASSRLDTLKCAAGMTFVDLAYDLSEAGHGIIEMMKKKDMSVVAVQSGLLRASLLKNTGNVIEAWHVVGTTIRNAQEIGLHATVKAHDPLVSVDAQWDHEMRHRVWFVLHNWDVHMAVVLGRPISTSTTAETVNIPDDLAQREKGMQPRCRTDQDPPTPFGVIRVGYDIAYRYFARVRELENHGSKIGDYHVVQETHEAIMRNMDRMPRWCRLEDPDIRFDERANYQWLPPARQSLTSGIYFVLLSLHRPYIFNVPESRTAALNAALMVLMAQKQLFYLSEPEQYLSFNMVYPLFDAMTISLAILVLFPNEKWDLRPRLLNEVSWGIDILAMVGKQNDMARSANSVLKSLLSRLNREDQHMLQHSMHKRDESTIESLAAKAGEFHAPAAGSDTDVTSEDFGTTHPIDSVPLSPHEVRPTASDSFDFDVESLLPPRPICDLFYQDIYAPASETLQVDELPSEFVQFAGSYPDDSFWNFMNDLSSE